MKTDIDPFNQVQILTHEEKLIISEGLFKKLKPIMEFYGKYQWQPIETAPKDESGILLKTEYEGIVIGYYGEACYRGNPIKLWMAEDWNADFCGCSPEKIEPTHWMPLPEPPKEEE